MNPSSALAHVLVRALGAAGVEHLVVCPGSRSAPLAYAAVAAERDGVLRVHVRVDERAAGFLALGLAKESGRPAAVVTTSGTAVANLHPAVLEAAHAGVPLLVLSADRPHELRGTGANQVTDQVRVFGTATRLFAEIPAPDDARPEAWVAVAVRAVAAARGTISGNPGPVQLNVGFREPLVPDTDEVPPVPRLTEVQSPAAPAPVPLEPGPRTVVVAGDGAGPQARELAEVGGWPLLAEPSSGARSGPNAVGPYRLLLGVPALGGAVERVVVLGRATLSRPVTALLSRDDVEIVVVSPRPDWADAGLRAARVLPAVTAAAPGDPAWLEAWRSAAKAAAAAIDAELDAGPLTGPLVAREVAAALAPGEVLVTGSSNPVRDLDLAAHPGEGVVLANRGLAGIDGTVSTASGVALARSAAGDDRVVRCLLGDLTFLHDAGGLLTGPLERRPHLQLVVLDDGGGGIFELLEHGEREDRGTFERVFGTPHGVDPVAIAAGYRVPGVSVRDRGELRAALAAPMAGVSLVHVPVERGAHREVAGRLREAVAGSRS